MIALSSYEANAKPSSSGELLCSDLEPFHDCRPESSRQVDVCGITSCRHQYASDAGRVVTGIDRTPAAAEIDFAPGAEIHRVGVFGHADITEITGAIAGRDTHAAAEGDGKMREIAADAGPVIEPAESRPQRIGFLVVEDNTGMDEIDDRLNTGPAEWCSGEVFPGKVRQRSVSQ